MKVARKHERAVRVKAIAREEIEPGLWQYDDVDFVVFATLSRYNIESMDNFLEGLQHAVRWTHNRVKVEEEAVRLGDDVVAHLVGLRASAAAAFRQGNYDLMGERLELLEEKCHLRGLAFAVRPIVDADQKSRARQAARGAKQKPRITTPYEKKFSMCEIVAEIVGRRESAGVSAKELWTVLVNHLDKLELAPKRVCDPAEASWRTDKQNPFMVTFDTGKAPKKDDARDEDDKTLSVEDYDRAVDAAAPQLRGEYKFTTFKKDVSNALKPKRGLKKVT